MTKSPDDMVMTPRFIRPKSTNPGERAKEERRTLHHRQRKRASTRSMRRATVARQMRRRRVHGRRKPTGYQGAARATKALAAKSAGRVVPVAGWILLLMDLVILGGQAARRFGVHDASGRLVEAEDAHTIFGDLDEKATANAEVLGALEGDRGALRAIGQDGGMSSSLRSNVAKLKAQALRRAHGADMIARDPHFDSADSLLDQLIALWDMSGVKAAVDRAIPTIRLALVARGVKALL